MVFTGKLLFLLWLNWIPQFVALEYAVFGTQVDVAFEAAVA
jgi:hypothetical protein